MPDKKISQLDSTTSVNTGAVFPLSQTESGSLKTVKGTVEQIGDYIAKTQDHSTLNTVSKKIIGAINEILAGSIKGTASGSVASFADGGDNIPVKSLVADIVASQAGSGTPSPTNPRAISGYTDVVIKNDVQGVTQDTHTINLGSTVYGGKHDVTKGVLTLTHNFITFDGSSDETWVNHVSLANLFLIDILTDAYVNNAVSGYAISNEFDQKAYSAVSGLNNGEFALGLYTNIKRLAVKNTDCVTASDFRTWLSTHNMQICYKLATPITIQLTPTKVRTLFGENNIYADSGDVEVTYFTDKANEIAELIETYMNL